jgi:hypothetical protein
VRCDKDVPFFPRIYNEDWLFLLQALAAGSVRLAGDLSQRAFDPFADSRRARREEFGDVLAESLYALLHECKDEKDPMVTLWAKAKDKRWWSRRIALRRRFIEHIESVLRAKQQTPKGLFEALAEARGVLRDSWSNLLADYMVDLEKDLHTWKRKLETLAPEEDASPLTDPVAIEAVFTSLGLKGGSWLSGPDLGRTPSQTSRPRKSPVPAS